MSWNTALLDGAAISPEAERLEKQLLFRLATAFGERVVRDGSGGVGSAGPAYRPLASERIVSDLIRSGLLTRRDEISEDLAGWVASADSSTLAAARLALRRPEGAVHFVPSDRGLYYDFANTDRVLSELIEAGADIAGRCLDFGCSSGRNLAVLSRAFGAALELYGVDPASNSIAWARQNVPGVAFAVSAQEPPLAFPEAFFDLVFAKSIWTHFSPPAGRRWLAEIARILKPGGHVFFSTHGPQDVALRLVFDFPKPNYAMIHGEVGWDRPSFLTAVIDGLLSDGFFFRPYRSVENQSDLRHVSEARTEDWGLMFCTPEWVGERLLPEGLSVARYTPGATAGRLDGYVARKSE